MIIPIRCFTCGKEISSHYEQYLDLEADELPKNEIFKIIGIKRICCKRMFIGNVDISNNFLQFEMSQNK